MAVSVNQLLANTLGLADPLGRIADDGRVGFNGRVNINGRPIRFGYSFDGVDDYGSLGSEVSLGADFNVSITIDGIQNTGAGQDIVGSELNFKFGIDAPTGRISFLVGNGSSWVVNHLSSVSAYDGRRYTLRANKSGNLYRFFINSELIFSVSNASAVTPKVFFVAKRSNGNFNYARGRIFDLNINGVLWRMDQRNQVIQPSTPAGNNMTLVNTTSDRWQEVPQ